MVIIGCDYHPSMQQIVFVDTETKERGERRLMHSDGEAERFYTELKRREVEVRVGRDSSLARNQAHIQYTASQQEVEFSVARRGERLIGRQSPLPVPTHISALRK